MIGLLRDARKASIDYNATVTLRIDPKTLKYQVDTSTAMADRDVSPTGVRSTWA